MMKDKYNLTQRENIFLAKKTVVENVYSSAKLEGVNITFPQTKTIMDGMSVSNLDMDDMQKVINLRDAWKFVLNNIDKKFNLEYAEKINGFVAYNESLEWGVLRDGIVGISGVKYKPTIPVRREVVLEIDEILLLSRESTTKKAIHYMLYAMRKQLFWDGNKRTALISANKLLIESGNGVLIIKEDDLEEFNTRLSAFYETNDYSKIDKFIYDNCVFGIDYK